MNPEDIGRALSVLADYAPRLEILLRRHLDAMDVLAATARDAALEEAAEALERIKGNLGGIRAAGMVRAMKKDVTAEWQGERATVENGLLLAPRKP